METEAREGAASIDRMARDFRVILVVLVVIVIALSSVTAVSLYESELQSQNSRLKPGFIHLLGPQEMSAMAGGNWSRVTSTSGFFNSSNPTGTLQIEYLSRSSPTYVFAAVTVSGYNSTANALFAYENDQLGYILLSNFTQKGVFEPSQNYTLYGICYQGGACSSVEGLAVVSEYVVRIGLSSPVFSQVSPSAVNATLVSSLVRAQISAIPAR